MEQYKSTVHSKGYCREWEWEGQKEGNGELQEDGVCGSGRREGAVFPGCVDDILASQAYMKVPILY